MRCHPQRLVLKEAAEDCTRPRPVAGVGLCCSCQRVDSSLRTENTALSACCGPATAKHALLLIGNVRSLAPGRAEEAQGPAQCDRLLPSGHPYPVPCDLQSRYATASGRCDPYAVQQKPAPSSLRSVHYGIAAVDPNGVDGAYVPCSAAVLGQPELRADAIEGGAIEGDGEEDGGVAEVRVDLRPGQQGVVAVGAVHGDQEPQPVLAVSRVESRSGVGEDVVQERLGEVVVLDAAGGALEGDLRGVLRPGEQVGHRQPGRTAQVTGDDDLGQRAGCRIGGCEGLTHGLPTPAGPYPTSRTVQTQIPCGGIPDPAHAK